MPITMTATRQNGNDTIQNLRSRLAFNEMTMGLNGSVMARQEKVTLREKHGFCTECVGLPILLYNVKKSRMNPLWVTKEPRAVAEECAGGICFICHPDKDPSRAYRRQRRVRGPPRTSFNNSVNQGAPPRRPGGPHGSSGSLPQGELSMEMAPPPSESLQNSTSSFQSPGTFSSRPHTAADSSGRGRIPQPPLGEDGDTPPPSMAGRRIRTSDFNDSSSNLDDTASSRGDPRAEFRNSLRQQSSTSNHTSSSYQPSQSSLHDLPLSEHGPLKDHENQQQWENRSQSSHSIRSGSSSDAPVAAATTTTPATTEETTMSKAQIEEVISEADTLIKEMVNAGNSEFFAEIVLGTIRTHVKIPEVQIYCLRIIWDLCKDDDNNKQAVMRAGAAEDIIKAMRSFSDNLGVQEKGCGAIWSLGVNGPNRVELVRHGACKIIMKAIQHYIATESLVRTAVGAMRTLSPESEAREAFKVLDASKITTEAMVIHRSRVSIQRDGCAFLSNCAVNIEKQFVTVVPVEELDVILQAIAHHRQDVSVMQGACFALKNYTHEDQNCRRLRQCKSAMDVIAYASSYKLSECVQDDANDILERLQMSKMMDESIEDQAYMSLVQIVDSQGSSAQAPRSVFDFMRNYDWSVRIVGASLQIFRRLIIEHEPHRRYLVDTGMVRDIIRYCDEFVHNESVCEEGCAFVECLSEREDDLEELLNAGCCEFLLDCFQHMNNEQVMKRAMEALKYLSANKDAFNRIKLKLPLVQEAIESFPTSDAIQLNGIAIISRLD